MADEVSNNIKNGNSGYACQSVSSKQPDDIIDQVLWSICGWSLDSLIDMSEGDIYQVGDTIDSQMNSDDTNPFKETLNAINLYNNAGDSDKKIVDEFFKLLTDSTLRGMLEVVIDQIGTILKKN